MRALFAVLALLGLVGIAFGVLTMIRGSSSVPFSYEDYGGPGAIIGGALLLSVSLYLLSAWPRIEADHRTRRHG